MTAKLRDLAAKLRKRMHDRIRGTLNWLQQVVRGYFQYHAIPGNLVRMNTFRGEVLRIWYCTLRRRSQRRRLNWKEFLTRFAPLLPPIRVLHPYPDVRFDAKHPRIRGRNRVR